MAKIGFIISSLFACGGEERVVSIIASELAKHHDVTIYTYENRRQEGVNRNDYNLSDKIKVEEVSNRKDSLFRLGIKILYYHTGLTDGRFSGFLLKKAYYPDSLLKEWRERINEEKFDLMIGVSGAYTMLLGYIADQISAVCISWEHSSFEGYFAPKTGYYRNRMELYRECAAKMKTCVVLNQDIAEKYKRILGLVTTVISNPKSFSSIEKAVMTEKCFVTCGRAEAEKGYDDLILAFYQFWKTNKDWRLLIIGGGSLQEKLEQMAKDLGIRDSVTITGYVHNVAELLRQGSIFVMTSRWEGFPMSVTEALEIGLPIIAYDIPAMQPLVTDGVEGRIVPAFENAALVMTMKELADDLNQRQRMSEAALKKADTLSPDRIAEKWYELFEQLKL